MSASAVLLSARAAGLTLALSPAGRIAIRGPAKVLERFKPALLENRDAIIQELAAEGDAPSLEEPLAAVEKLLDTMAEETERRREWWTRPPAGWPETITLRNIVRGETTTIRLQRKDAGR